MLKLIRKAKINDINAINKLGEVLHPSFSRLFHIETEIVSNISIVLVNEEEGMINAYLYAQDFGDNIDLLSIFVDNNARHRHIGSALIKELINLSDNKSITLEVAEDNYAALALYDSLGFKKVGIRKNYYKDTDAYIMKWSD